MPHVLIVEDDPSVREFFDSLLKHHGYSTETACDGREGLTCAERRRPCLVLLDLMMPVMDGWEFRHRQLRTPTIADVPVICVTAKPEASEAGEVLGAPCLPKPVDCDTIMDAVESACGRRTLIESTEGLARYDAWHGVQVIGDCFVLSLSGRVARCEIRTHPVGWELRLKGGAHDGFELAQVCRTEREVFDVGSQWEAKMVLKGWR